MSPSHVPQPTPRSVEQLGDGGDHPPGGRAAALAQHGHVDLHYKLALPLQYNSYTGFERDETLITSHDTFLTHPPTSVLSVQQQLMNKVGLSCLLSHNFSAVPPLHFAIFVQPMRWLATGWEPIRTRDQHK